MDFSEFLPRHAVLTGRMVVLYRIAWQALQHLQISQNMGDPEQLAGWLEANRHFHLGSSSYRLSEGVESALRREAQGLGEPPNTYIVLFTSNLLLAMLQEKPDVSELDAPPSLQNFPAWFFYNYGMIIDRPQDTAPVFFGLYLALKRAIEEEHPVVGGVWLSAFFLREAVMPKIVGGGWIPALGRIVLIVPGWLPDFEGRFFLNFLHEYSHFLDCCVIGRDYVLADPPENQDYDLFYFSARHAEYLGFSLSPLNHRYLQTSFKGRKNLWWRNLDSAGLGDAPPDDQFPHQYKNHSPAECVAELYSAYFQHGRDILRMEEFSPCEKTWFAETFLAELKRTILNLAEGS